MTKNEIDLKKLSEKVKLKKEELLKSQKIEKDNVKKEENKEEKSEKKEVKELKEESLDDLIEEENGANEEIIQIQRIGNLIDEPVVKEVQNLEEVAEEAQITKKEKDNEKIISPYANVTAAAYQNSNSPYKIKKMDNRQGIGNMGKKDELFSDQGGLRESRMNSMENYESLGENNGYINETYSSLNEGIEYDSGNPFEQKERRRTL